MNHESLEHVARFAANLLERGGRVPASSRGGSFSDILRCAEHRICKVELSSVAVKDLSLSLFVGLARSLARSLTRSAQRGDEWQ